MARNTIVPITRVTFDSSTLTTSYQAINGTGFSQPLIVLRIVNNSNRDIDISFDGVNDHDFLEDAGVFQLGSQSNALPPSNIALFSKNTRIYFKAASAGTGNIYLVGYYQPRS